MKKVLTFIILMIVCFQTKAFAAENINSNLSLKDLDNLTKRLQIEYEYIPDLSFSNLVETYKENHSLGATTTEVFKGLGRYLIKELLVSSKLLIELLFIAMLCAILQNLQSSFSENVSQIAYYACYLLMVVVIVKSFGQVVNLARSTIDNLVMVMNALMPTLITLIISVGGFVSAATLDPVVVFIIKLISDIIRDFVLPITILIVLINIVDNISDNIKITKLGGLVKQVCTWLLGFVMTVFVGVVTIRSSTSATLDQLTLKASKFAMDNFIPIVGKTLSDAITTVAGYSLVLKDAVSVIGLILLVIICIFPLLKILLISLVYKLVGAIMEPLVDKKITDCLSNIGSSLTLVFAAVLSVSVMFFILLTIIISTGRLVMSVG